MKRFLTSLAFIIGFVFQGHSQVLNNQFESQSACNAIPICGLVKTSPYTFSTSAPFNTNPIGTCAANLGGTTAYNANWVYYRFTAYTTGAIRFTITSANAAVDLDWALWDITVSGCGSLTIGNTVECNAGPAGITGINTTMTVSAPTNLSFEPDATVIAGNTYILGIANPLGAGAPAPTGFTIDFTGSTASIIDNTKPFMASVLPFDPCSPVSLIKIKLSEPVRCSQVGAGTDFTLSGTTPTFVVTPGANCPGGVNATPNIAPNYGNATDTATLTFATALSPGTYTITAVANAFFDLCGKSDSTQKTLVFTVPAPFKDSVRSGFDCIAQKYIDTVYGVNGLSPYQYKAVGGGLPAAAGTYGAAIPGYTIYTVSGGSPVTYTIRDAGGCEVDTTLTRVSVLALGAPNLSASASPPCHDQFSLDSISVISQSGGIGPYSFSLSPSFPGIIYVPTPANPTKWKNIVFPGLGTVFTVTVTDANGCTKTGLKNLVNPTVLSLSLPAPTNPPCFGDSSGKICFTAATGGTPLYSYSIAPLYPNMTFTTSPGNCFNNLPAAIYTITVTDANGCTATATKTLSQPSLITINTSAATILNPTCPDNCNGTFQPIATGGTGGKKFYKYPFDIATGTYADSVVTTVAPANKFYNLCAGTYTILAKDALGCTSTALVTLSLPPIPVLNVGIISPVACFGGTGTIAVNITNGTPPYTVANYTYQPFPVTGMTVSVSGVGGINGLYSGVPGGTYDLIITNTNACSDTVFGVIMTEPSAPVTYSSVVVDSVLCFGTSTGTITAQATGGTTGANAYQYAIKFGAAPFSPFLAPTMAPNVFSGLAAGTYTIRVRDQNLCTKDSVVTIYQPTKLNLLLDDIDATCFGTSDGEICVIDTGGTPGYQYKLGALGIYSPVQAAGAIFCYSNLAASAYSIYTIDAKGCLDTLIATVPAIPLPIVSFTATPNDTVCDGTAITLCGTGADSYVWTGGINDCSAFVPTLGSSQYIVTGLNTTTGCSNLDTADVLVNPIPSMTDPADQVLCDNALTNPVLFTANVPGTTFGWTHDATAAIGIGTSGTGNIPAFTAVNTGSTDLVVTFTVTPTGPAITTCVGADQTFTITIKPTPVLAAITDQRICAGDVTADILFGSTVTGTTFSWTNSNNTIGLPLLSGTGDIFSFLGLNSSNVPNIGLFVVTPTANGCPGATQSFSITIDPLPILTDPSDQILCNNANTTAVNFISTVAGTTFTWINDQPAIGLLGSGSGNIPSFTVVNISNAPIVATITVTPTGPLPNNCIGANQIFTITVNPTPNIAAIADQTLCAGINTIPIVFGSNVAGTNFSWTNSNPSIGLAASSVGFVTGIPTFVAINATSVPQVAIIIVTPDASTCPGTNDTFTITVDPIPVLSVIPNQTVCDNESTTAINFVSNVLGTTFTWTYTATAGANIGLVLTGSNNIPAFTAINIGTTPIIATFTVTPTGPSTTNCDGATQVFTITVLPRQNPSFSYNPSTYCQTGIDPLPIFGAGATLGGTFSATPVGLNINTATGLIDLSASLLNTYAVKYVTPGPCPDSSTFNVTITLAPTTGFSYPQLSYCQSGIDPTPVFVAGASAGVFSALPSGLAFVSTSTGQIDLTNSVAGTYTVTNFIVAAGGCAASTSTTLVTIDSTGVLTDPANQQVCNGFATAAVNFTSTVVGTTYAWTHNGTGIGIANTGTGNIPAFTALNTGTTPIIVTFQVTPTGPAPNFCVGLDQSFDITINPTPVLTDPADQVICAGDVTADVLFVSTVTGTTFTWTNSNGTIGIGTSDTGDIFSFLGLNAGNVPNIGLFNVIPTANGCQGVAQNFTINVNPIPSVNVVANQVLCNNASTTAIIFGGPVAGTTFAWTNSDPSVGLLGSGTGNIPSFTAINTTNTPVVATITVTPTGPAPTNCVGAPQIFTITVNPTPDITTIADQLWCAGSNSTAVVFASGVAGTTFTWTNSNTAIGLGANSGGPVAGIPSFVTTNATSVPQIGVIVVTPSASACPGAPTAFSITVDPLPVLNVIPNQTVCDNENTTTINFVSNVIGTTFDWSYTSSSNIGLANPGTGNILSFTGVNIGTTPIVATFTVTPTGPATTNCVGADQIFTITVLPRQNATFTYALSTYCQTGANPLPIYTAATTLGGTFSATPAGLSLNTATGEIDLALSLLNTYTIQYITPGPCPDTATFNVTITLAPEGDYTYAATNYCQGGIDPLPVFAPGASAGTFSAIPSGLTFFNVNTGQIDLSASNTGTYTVSNIIAAAGGCGADTATFVITIDSATVMSDPPDLSYCVGTLTNIIVPFGSVAGTTYTWSNSNTAIGLVASGNGAILPFTTTNIGTTPIVATITFIPTGPAPNFCLGVSQSFTITVNPNATIALTSAAATTSQVVCINTLMTNITYTVAGTGNFATVAWAPSNPGAGVTGVYNAGVFTISGTPTVVGVFTYTVTATGTCGSVTSTGTLTVNPNAILTLTSAPATASQIVCEGTPISNIVYSITGTGNNASVAWSPFTPGGITGTYAAGVFTMSGASNTPGIFTYTVTATGTCGSTSMSGSLEITPLQDPTFTYPNPTNCQSGTTAPNFIATIPGTFSATPLGLVFTNTTTGVIDLAASTVGTYLIKYVTSGTCKDSTTLQITVTNAPCPLFSYAATNYCQSSPNPTPLHPFGCSNGTYTSLPAGLSINATTGVINLLASTPGTYDVYNTIAAAGTCPLVADTFTVTITSKPTLAFVSSTQAGCNPNCNGTVTTSVSGGTPGYGYTIAGTGSPLVSVAGVASQLCAGSIYTITVTDAIGCTGTLTVSVTAASAPSLTGVVICTSTPVACDGQYVASPSGGSGFYSFSIVPVAVQAPIGTFIGLCPGVFYTVTLLDLNTGCTDTDTFTMCAPGQIFCQEVLSAHVNVSCFGGSNGAFKDSIYGGTPPYTFVGITGPSGAVPFLPAIPVNFITASGLLAGNYTVSWLDSNNVPCNTIIIITEPLALTFSVPVISTPSCSPGCDGTLSISANGGTGTKTYSIAAPAGIACLPTQTTAGNFTGMTVGVYTISVTDANNCTASTTVQINASPIPTLNLAHTNPSCNDVCDGTILSIVGSGTPAFTFAIASPTGAICVPTQAGGNFSTLGGGIYTVTVTDTKNCSVTGTQTLVNPPVLLLNPPVSTAPSCNGICDAGITLVGVGGTGQLTYSVTSPLVTNITGIFTALCSGTYTVSVTDITNCSMTGTVQITDPPLLIWDTTAFTNITCAGSANGIISVIAQGGTGTILYSKDGALFSTSGSFSGLFAATYTITAKDSKGCSITSAFTIVEPPLLVLDPPVTSNVSCFGSNDGTLTISANGGTPGYTYVLNPSGASNITGVFAGLPANTYTVTVTDVSGCTKSLAGIVITQPAQLQFSLVNHQDVACFGDATGTITVNTQGGTGTPAYSIIPNIGTQGPTGFFSGLTAGNYTIIATDANNCSISTSVFVNQGPQIFIANVTMTEPICFGEPNGRISLTAFGGTGQLKYKINGGTLQNDSVFTNLVAGNYSITVVDALGCTTSTSVDVTEPTAVGAIVNLQSANCTDSKDGKAIIIGTGGRGGYKYYITPGLHINKSGIFVGLEPGTYVLRVVDTTDCEYTTNITINPPANPLANMITKQDLACNGVGNEGTATANAAGGTPPYTYLWSTEPPQTTPQASTLYFGFYDVTVIDANGCIVKDTVYIQEGPCCDVSFIPNAFSPNGDQVNDEFRVLTTAGINLLQLEIYNRWGKRIWSTIDYRRGWDGKIEGVDAAIDTYYYIFRYKCTRDNITYTKKGDVILIR